MHNLYGPVPEILSKRIFAQMSSIIAKADILPAKSDSDVVFCVQSC